MKKNSTPWLLIYLTIFFLLTGICEEVNAQRTHITPNLNNTLPGEKMVSGLLSGKSKLNNRRITANKSLPLTGHRFRWDATAWSQYYTIVNYSYSPTGVPLRALQIEPSNNQIVGKDSVAYDAQGNKIFEGEYFLKTSTTNQLELNWGYKYLYTYNSNSQITEVINEEFQGGLINPWVPYERTTYQYTLSGKVQETFYYVFFNNSWSLRNKHVYTYNTNDQLLEIVEHILHPLNTTVLNPVNRDLYTYNAASILTDITTQRFKNGNWENDTKWTNIVFKSASSDTIIERVEKAWVNNNWLNQNKVSWNFDPNGGYILTMQDWDGNAWQNFSRSFQTYDTNGNYIGSKNEEWINNSWVGEYDRMRLHTYTSNNDLAETVLQDWDVLSNSYKNISKEVYFTHFILNSSKENIESTNLHIYPNPTSNFLTIDLPQSQLAILVSVTDLTGKIVLNQNFIPTETKQLNLEKLNNGIYLLHLETKEGRTVRKIVKN